MASGFSGAGYQTGWGSLTGNGTIVDGNTATGASFTGFPGGNISATAGRDEGSIIAIPGFTAVVGYVDTPTCILEYSTDSITWHPVFVAIALILPGHLGTFALETITVDAFDLPFTARYTRLSLTDDCSSSGQTPVASIREMTAILSTIITPGTGSIAFTGLVPSVIVPMTITPSSGSVTFAGQQPMVIVQGPVQVFAENAPGLDNLYKTFLFVEAAAGADSLILAQLELRDGVPGGDSITQDRPSFVEGPPGDDAFYTLDLAKLIEGPPPDDALQAIAAFAEGPIGSDLLAILAQLTEGAPGDTFPDTPGPDSLISRGPFQIFGDGPPGSDSVFVSEAVRIFAEGPLPPGEGLVAFAPGTTVKILYEPYQPGGDSGGNPDSLILKPSGGCARPLVPVPCNNTLIQVIPPLQNPPPGGNPFVAVFVPVTFDFSILRNFARTGQVSYFTCTVQSNSHDWAVASAPELLIQDGGGLFLDWHGGGTLHTIPLGYYQSPGSPPELYDADKKTGLFDFSPSPPFGPYFLYYAPDIYGAFVRSEGPFLILNGCGINTNIRFGLVFYFYYARPFLGFGSFPYYNTFTTAPIVTVTNLTAWCCPLQPWLCPDPCTPSVIASGHSGLVCLSTRWERSDALPNGGFSGPRNNYAPLNADLLDFSHCNVKISVGCLSPERISKNDYHGPWTWTVITSDRCTFDGIDYTRVASGTFTVTADVICSEPPPPGARQSVLLQQKVLGHVVVKNT